MSQRGGGMRIKINPHNRYDLSHLTPEEASQTLKHFLEDLCFWGSLPPPLHSRLNTGRRTPPYYYHQGQQQEQRMMDKLIRQQSSGGSSDRSHKRTKDKSSRSSSQNEQQRPPRAQARVWKTAVDPSTGQTYYYDPVSRQTQWEKPEEIRAMEKQQRKERRQRDKIFFAEMEKNMRSHFAEGRLTKDYTAFDLANFAGGPPKEPLGLQVPSKQQRIRTISAMDERMLAQVDVDTYSPQNSFVESSSGGSNSSNQQHTRPPPRPGLPPVADPPTSLSVPGRPPLPSRLSSSTSKAENASSPEESQSSRGVPFDRWDSLELSPDNSSSHMQMGSPELQGMRLLDENPLYHTGHHAEEQHPQGHIRRNTGNTMFVNSTMTSPDIQGTIRCVCGVYRAHILQSVESPSHSPGSVVPVGSTVVNPDVFRDDLHGKSVSTNGSSRKFGTPDPKGSKIPTMDEIESFYKEFFRRSQMEHDTIIMSLIYIERLIKRTEGNIRPTPLNWRSMLFSCMILASKVWDDLSMWNIDFSNVSVATGLSSFTIQRINQLEVALLSILRFDVRVPASEYAKYYFLIRTMLFRSGQLSAEASQNVPPASVDQNRRTKSVDWGAEPLLKDVSLEQLLSPNMTIPKA